MSLERGESPLVYSPHHVMANLNVIAVVITLIPLSHDLPPRTLTLSKELPPVSIGRSSQSEKKKRIPAEDNAWFDSRVVSRQHAELSLGFEKEVLRTLFPLLLGV